MAYCVAKRCTRPKLFSHGQIRYGGMTRKNYWTKSHAWQNHLESHSQSSPPSLPLLPPPTTTTTTRHHRRRHINNIRSLIPLQPLFEYIWLDNRRIEREILFAFGYMAILAFHANAIYNKAKGSIASIHSTIHQFKWHGAHYWKPKMRQIRIHLFRFRLILWPETSANLWSDCISERRATAAALRRMDPIKYIFKIYLCDAFWSWTSDLRWEEANTNTPTDTLNMDTVTETRSSSHFLF